MLCCHSLAAGAGVRSIAPLLLSGDWAKMGAVSKALVSVIAINLEFMSRAGTMVVCGAVLLLQMELKELLEG